MLHAEAMERFGHETPAAAVERRIDDLEVIGHTADGGGIDGHGHDLLEEGLVGLLAEILDQPLLERGIEAHALNVLEDVQLRHIIGDRRGMLRGQLRAVGPVDLIAVVFLGVVARGDVDARLRAVVQHGVGQLRRGTQSVEHADVDAVGGHDGGGLMREDLAVDAAVIADDDALLAGLGSLGLDDLGERLRGVADDMDVHAAQADGHLTAQTGSAELQRREKAAFDLLGVVLNGLELLPFRGAEGGAVQPALILFLITHRISSPSNSSSSSSLSRRAIASCSRVSGTYISVPKPDMPSTTLPNSPLWGYRVRQGMP